MIHRHLKLIAVAALALGVVLAAAVGGYVAYLSTTLPEVTGLDDPEYSLPTVIYDRQGTAVQKIFVKRRKLVGYEQLPQTLINALIAKEDSRFFEHHGIDPLRIIKAAWVNLVNWRKMQGASTLTQQTARQFFLTNKRTYTRKIKEALLALQIERRFTKPEILTLYLNKVNFGDAWGVAAAAEYYFGKPVEELTLGEGAILVGLLPAPNYYKPTRNPHLARQQRNIVLQRMAEEGFISRSEQLAAAAEPIVLATHDDPTIEAAAYYVEHVRRILLERYGSQKLYEGGLHVYTAMDLQQQTAAHEALNRGVRTIDRRRGYRGPLDTVELDEAGHVPEEVLQDLNPPPGIRPGEVARGVVIGVEEQQVRVVLSPRDVGVISWEQLSERWKRRVDVEASEEADDLVTHPIDALSDILAPGDLIEVEPQRLDVERGEYVLHLHQEPLLNGAVYAMDPRNGYVSALVGGSRFGRTEGASEFIRATQAERQPGSSFKPIIYATAIDEGYTPATILDDSPRVFTLASGKKHSPQNYDNRFVGKLPLRQALVRSRNVPTVQLVDEVGARRVIETARRFGISTPIPEESIIALGTHSVRLSELTQAYSVFAAGGERVRPVYIRRIEDAEGNVIYEAEREAERVISAATAYLVTDILQDVVDSPWGTAHSALSEFDRPAAGKTGTTQNYTDAWFMGFIPQLVTGVYVGFDDPQVSLGPSETGSRAAAPIWLDFMQQASASMAVATFEQPPTVVAHRVDSSGHLLGPCDPTSGSRFELFKASAIPARLQNADGCRPVLGGGRSVPGSGGSTGGSEDVEL